MPCYGEDRDKLVLRETKDNVSRSNNIYVPIERGTILSECPEYEWHANIEDTTRFFTIGL